MSGFAGFTPEATDFLKALAANNNREWFLANKAVHERAVKAPLGALVESLALGFAAHDVPLMGSAKTSLFRINRDVRFSNDKSPYKVNAGAVMSRDGMRRARGLLYFHIGPEGGLVATGFYAPEPADLALLRLAITRRPKEWLKILADLKKAGLELSREETLARPAKGFETADPALAESLKLKGFTIRREIPTARLHSPALQDEIFAFAQTGLPLLQFGWRALTG